MMFYKSTRGGEERLTASQAILKGIADNGGLFVPEKIPVINLDLKELAQKNYKELAFIVMKEFLTDFTYEELNFCVEEAYNNKKFDCYEIAPLIKIENNYLLELFHGATIAFKDMALSVLPYLLKVSIKKQKVGKDIVILTATSGDTGKAALEGFTEVEGTKIIVFFPEEGVSEVQKRQMTTHAGSNTYVVGIQGNFDDAQRGVKNIFNDKDLSNSMEQAGYMFSSANSINIGRLIPQIVYYFYAYCELIRKNEISDGEHMNVVVPTGNFGNILAAYYAKLMGLPIGKLICASNDNNVLTDFIKTGIYDSRREFYTTISPSMDILISSNLERFLYHVSGENCSTINKLMDDLKNRGYYKIDEEMKAGLGDFYGGFATEEEIVESIKELYHKEKYLMDTHTAVAYYVNKNYLNESNDDTKAVIVSTASPYKFTGAVMGAINDSYRRLSDIDLIGEMNKLLGGDIPTAIKDIDKRPVVHREICSVNKMKDLVINIMGLKS
jgi:threonine synthase